MTKTSDAAENFGSAVCSTPGPWKVSDNNSSEPMPQPAFPGVRDCATDELICETFGTSEVCKANARLIAAAPELLEELEKVLAWIPTNSKMYDAGKAIDAIRKATGVERLGFYRSSRSLRSDER